LKVLELQPDDLNAREKLATGFALTNQRDKAIAMLEEIIKKQPAKYQPYELLAQLFDEAGRALERASQSDQAKAQFSKAAANYEQSLLINPTRANTYLRLAELLIVPLKDSERASKLLTEARQRFPGVPEFTYFLAIAQREAKHPQQAVITFEEAVNEAQLANDEVLNARFYFDYGAAADQAALYDKAADLFRKSISLDPANSAEACNYVAFMWADHNMHLDEAEEMVNRALQFDPDNGAYLDTLGWIQYRKGKFDDALNELLRAARNLTKPDPIVLEHIGDAYAKLNRVPQALDFWQKAMALGPENKSLAEKIEKTKTTISKGPPGKINRID
jgi:tetratricopeptide (TPR) repeat protein